MDGFFANLLLLLVAQSAAWQFLRTGRVWLGAIATALLWCLLDAWLVARYVFAHAEPPWTYLLVGFQATAAAILALWGFAAWRRRWSRTARQRPQWFVRGLTHYLRGEVAAAEQVFVRLVRCDPCDAAAWAALGNVLRHRGQAGRARRCYRRALRVDLRGSHRDHVRLQLARLPATAGRPRRS